MGDAKKKICAGLDLRKIHRDLTKERVTTSGGGFEKPKTCKDLPEEGNIDEI